MRQKNIGMSRKAAWSMDMMARLSLLEGAAGVPPGTWLKKQSRGFMDAMEVFGPGLDPSWSSTQNQRLFDFAVIRAKSLLRTTPGIDAMDVIQDMIVYSGSPTGPKRKKLFYSIGAALRKYHHELGDGKVTPQSGVVQATINVRVREAVIDVLREQAKKKPASPEQQDLILDKMYGGGGLDPDLKEKLLLLGLRSADGPGKEIRDIIFQEIPKAFGKNANLVRLFLEKIPQKKWSLAELREHEHIADEQWFTRVFSKIRQEILEETGVSPQTLTNVLGSKASHVFTFMKQVGRHPRVRKIIEEIADQIELLEPAVHRMATEESSLDQEFEMNYDKAWSEMCLPGVEYSRGPAPLRVAFQDGLRRLASENTQWKPIVKEIYKSGSRSFAIRTAFLHPDFHFRKAIANLIREVDSVGSWDVVESLLIVAKEKPHHRKVVASLLRKAAFPPKFLKWVSTKKFKNPETGRERKFTSLPWEEQAPIYRQWSGEQKKKLDKQKPKDLPENSRVPLTKLKTLTKGDELWASWAPKQRLKVLKTNEKDGKTMLEVAVIDPKNPDKIKETRTISQDSIDATSELHKFDEKKFWPWMDTKEDKPKADKPKADKPKADKPKADKPKATPTELNKFQGKRKYVKKVQTIAKDYALEGKDADELYDFVADKPDHGQKLSPQKLMSKFLQKAAPETKERMKGMSVNDFMKMYRAIMDEETE